MDYVSFSLFLVGLLGFIVKKIPSKWKYVRKRDKSGMSFARLCFNFYYQGQEGDTFEVKLNFDLKSGDICHKFHTNPKSILHLTINH